MKTIEKHCPSCEKECNSNNAVYHAWQYIEKPKKEKNQEYLPEGTHYWVG